MRLNNAKCCLNPDCQEVFEGSDQCPRCGGTAWQWLYVWVYPESRVAKLHDSLNANLMEAQAA